VIEIEAKLDGIETWMQRANLFDTEAIRPINEGRMRACWKLGQLLAMIERGKAPGKGKMISVSTKSFLLRLKKLNLKKDRAIALQRIGTLPSKELDNSFEAARKDGDLVQFSDLIRIARPYWYKASRQRKHRKIAAAASEGKQSRRSAVPIRSIVVGASGIENIFTFREPSLRLSAGPAHQRNKSAVSPYSRATSPASSASCSVLAVNCSSRKMCTAAGK
jgi:hypothetical protein